MFAINIFLIILGVGLLIFVHELGHFLVAKLARVKVEIFSLGFGPAFFKFRKGETEYRLCLIPLGGYVKMAGESIVSGESTGAPYEFVSKPPFTRIKVFAAGAVMNFLLAFPLCILMYLIGISLSAPLVGFVQPGSAESKAGILPGDIIQTVDNVVVDSMEDYKFAVLRKTIGETCQVQIRRNNQELTLPLIARGSEGLGVMPRQNIIAGIGPGSPADRAGLVLNDEIIEIDGEPVVSGHELKKIRDCPGQPINFKVRHSDNTVKSYEIIPEPMKQIFYDLEIDEVNFAPLVKVVKNGPAARGGMQDNDKILEINGQPIVSWGQLLKTMQARQGESLNIAVERNGQKTILSPIVPVNGFIEIKQLPANIIGEVISGTPLAQAGLQTGDIIISGNGKKISSLGELNKLVTGSGSQTIKLDVKRDGAAIQTELIPSRKEQGDIGITFRPKTVIKKYPLGKAITNGFKETWSLTTLTVQLIKKLFLGEESIEGVSGPIGIFYASYLMVQEGISKFIWLLALFTINLAILNLLPIPILDGGGILFTLIEKIKGSPVSVKIQVASQYIGLFILLSLVLFATYNDVFHRLGL